METVVGGALRGAEKAWIASGYISDDVVAKYEDEFYRIVDGGGSFRLLIGMAFHEGLPGKTHRHLQEIDQRIRRKDMESGVFVPFVRRFHGKIYWFEQNGRPNAFVGSSNFSRSGLSENMECTALLKDEENRDALQGYLDYLFHPDVSVSLLKANIPLLGTREYLERISLENLSDLKRYDPASMDLAGKPAFEYPLSRIVASERSNLNVYFGKGRWSRTTDKIQPRPWYEVEFIANKSLADGPLYPKGNFTAFTDDGYVMPMKTSGDYYKNIRSRNNLQILGQWIKGKLQNAGVLIPLTPVTEETLNKYGNDVIRFYKLGEGEYYMDFSPGDAWGEDG